jgi:hypothetical protein
MIIGINGYSGSGKDTVGTIIQYLSVNDDNQPTTSLEDVLEFPITHEWWLEEQSGWEIKKWAGKLKEIASTLTGIAKHKFEDQEFKKTNLSSEWDCNPPGKVGTMHKQPLTVREFLQRLGTDALRYGLHENAWVNALMSDYTPTQVQWAQGPIGGYEDGDMPNWIITDTRFPNEADAIREKDGVLIRVERPGVKPINDHPSEIGLDHYKFDHVIKNNGSIQELADQVKSILRLHKML